jgi:predicted Zn-dependent protease
MNGSHFSRQEAESLLRRTLGFSQADEARANLQSGASGNTRFAVNQISTSGDVNNASLVVTSAFGRRVASATTNSFDEASLRRVVETSERLARLTPENPEYMGELGPQDYPDVSAYFDATAALDAEARARAVREITARAQEAGLVSTGYLPYVAGAQAVATTRGLFAYGSSTRAALTTTVRTPDGTGSGWAGTGVSDWRHADPAALGETALEKARLSRDPVEVEPGSWTVILEPTAVANLVQRLAFSLNARAADEGRSFFSRPGGGNRIGERIVDERVTLRSDPTDPNLATIPFGGDGLPSRPITWVENGVLRNLIYDRFWADRQGREPTGFPAGFAMAGGDATIEEMIASTDRGLLVTRFWYIRSVDPRTILFTGLTRDGTFLVENGRIAHAVKNLRWNESPIAMLNNIEMMGTPLPVGASESGDVGFPMMMPAIKAREFTFTSVSDAV